jgi:hypothetical protein
MIQETPDNQHHHGGQLEDYQRRSDEAFELEAAKQAGEVIAAMRGLIPKEFSPLLRLKK